MSAKKFTCPAKKIESRRYSDRAVFDSGPIDKKTKKKILLKFTDLLSKLADLLSNLAAWEEC